MQYSCSLLSVVHTPHMYVHGMKKFMREEGGVPCTHNPRDTKVIETPWIMFFVQWLWRVQCRAHPECNNAVAGLFSPLGLQLYHWHWLSCSSLCTVMSSALWWRIILFSVGHPLLCYRPHYDNFLNCFGSVVRHQVGLQFYLCGLVFLFFL